MGRGIEFILTQGLVEEQVTGRLRKVQRETCGTSGTGEGWFGVELRIALFPSISGFTRQSPFTLGLGQYLFPSGSFREQLRHS